MEKILKGEWLTMEIMKKIGRIFFRRKREDAALALALTQLLQRADGEVTGDGHGKRDISLSFISGLPWFFVKPGRILILPREYGRKLSRRLKSPDFFAEMGGDIGWLDRVEFYAVNEEVWEMLNLEARNPGTPLGKALRDFTRKDRCVVLEKLLQ